MYDIAGPDPAVNSFIPRLFLEAKRLILGKANYIIKLKLAVYLPDKA